MHDIAILTPTRNSSKYILENLKSINAIPNISIHHIVIDGFSNDGTLDILNNFQPTKNVNMTIHKRKPHGISDALNYGLSKVDSEYLIVLHSDDIIVNQVQFIKNFVFFKQSLKCWSISPTYFFENQKVMKSDKLEITKINLLNLMKGNFISHPGVILKHNNKIDFNNNLKFAMDYELWIRLYMSSEPYVFFEPWAGFRIHPDGLSSKYEYLTIYEAFRVRQTYTKKKVQKLMNLFRFCDNLLHTFFRKIRFTKEIK